MKYLALLLVLLFATTVNAQETRTTEADTADVASIDQIVKAYYATTSGPAGKRDWARYRSLFQPKAQINARVFNVSGKLQYVAGTVDEYIGMVDEYFQINGFFEMEIGRSVHHYRDVAHVFSAYDAKLATNQKSYHRGVKSIQLVFDRNRWWIVNVLYNNESAREPIPDEYLFEKHRKE